MAVPERPRQVRAADLLTVPNLISIARLALIPVFLWLLLGRDDPVAAGWLLGLIGATDWIDGVLARRLGQVTELGKFLDPLADRIAVVAGLIGGMIAGVLPAWFALAILVREGLVGVGALYLGLAARAKLAVRRLGKIATLLVYAGVAWLFIGRGGDVEWVEWLGWIAGVPGLVLYYWVGFQYFADLKGTLTNARR